MAMGAVPAPHRACCSFASHRSPLFCSPAPAPFPLLPRFAAARRQQLHADPCGPKLERGLHPPDKGDIAVIQSIRQHKHKRLVHGKLQMEHAKSSQKLEANLWMDKSEEISTIANDCEFSLGSRQSSEKCIPENLNLKDWMRNDGKPVKSMDKRYLSYFQPQQSLENHTQEPLGCIKNLARDDNKPIEFKTERCHSYGLQYQPSSESHTQEHIWQDTMRVQNGVSIEVGKLHNLEELNENCVRSSTKQNKQRVEGMLEIVQERKDVDARDSNFTEELIGEQMFPICEPYPKKETTPQQKELLRIYDNVLVVDTIQAARAVVKMLTMDYRMFVHACDTEVTNIDVKEETPIGHGQMTCFSICPGRAGERADFGDGKCCIWVDVLDGEEGILKEFKSFFENPGIKKVWHNYSFDCHVIENYGIKLSGFYADTMHLARLWDSSRRTDGGYSLEALTCDPRVMSDPDGLSIHGKISMKSIFGKKNVKKDGSEGKMITVDSVDKLQREERELWICYSAKDSMSTLDLFGSLKQKLEQMEWNLNGSLHGKNMYDFYDVYWRPFGELLAKMETEGMLVDRSHLSEIQKIAVAEQKLAAEKFRAWASKYCPDAQYMNVGSDTQIRQLLFGGVQNSKDETKTLPLLKTFKVPNVENIIEEGKKKPLKYRDIQLQGIANNMKVEMYTPSNFPSVSGDALRILAGKISHDLIYSTSEEIELHDDPSVDSLENTLAYGTAYEAFGKGKEGKEACVAIAALCEICSIDSLISNFILPLQGNHVACNKGRIHCSLNINTETGRLSARTPNLQNQPALEKDRYKIRQAFVAAPGNSLIVADYGQLELRILAHLANCKSMLDAFKAGGDFHSRTALNMYKHINDAVARGEVLLEWHPQPGQENPPVPLLKDAFASERRKAKMLNFSIAYGKTAHGLARDWKVSLDEARRTVDLWYSDRREVLRWQDMQKKQAKQQSRVYTLLGRHRTFPNMEMVSSAIRGHIERAAINTPVQGSAADVAMCAMLEIDRNTRLHELGWRLLLQVHDEVILEGPTESAELAKAIVVDCMSRPFWGKNFLKVDLVVDAKCAQNWYSAK